MTEYVRYVDKLFYMPFSLQTDQHLLISLMKNIANLERATLHLLTQKHAPSIAQSIIDEVENQLTKPRRLDMFLWLSQLHNSRPIDA